ncbi:hypothetical protein HdH2rev_00191 [Escherichia phage vB_EcoS_HdH2]|uniref:Uncharacterized protein n=1 Tax=Escherichia phage vB_EcoS_HdH2 TaxID=2508174 RepID=A0A482N6M5_9CAUD|nr:hypothetical protein HWC04_gp007 [Escherichia phage vB_EcoS_HdH2]YP_009843486.1 hypothetical protein HWC04_gp069 [Escherichia phage vB_EcoS_HdH2]QBQ81105.1 hypothetical protein HdH2rev_00007 [Escherichia phage vB_EcoS_HdH2]QBQ81265.1 hypothetical protein HdH2rev_00191 [Escherichia phage vB_EcoS_HdH2]
MQNVTNAPKIGQSVFIPFVTKTDEATGKTERIKGAALMPFDVIDAVYAETERSNNGKTIYSVRVKSGDAVKVIQRNEKWEAVA